MRSGNNLADGNTATGAYALYSNTTGSENTANGFEALFSNTTGSGNTAYGLHAMYSNTTGSLNNALGRNALMSNTTGTFNTATGGAALFLNTTGNRNTATGREAMLSNTMGNRNTVTGYDALFNNTTGSNNIALGVGAGDNLTIGDNNIDIGNEGVAAESNTIRIGTQGTQTNTYIAGVYGTTVSRGATVFVDPNGRLGTRSSSQRFKDGIKPMDKASEAILALKPVTFHYKKEIDPDATPQFGLVAEAVEKINPDLIARDADGKPYTVRYEAVNAMLLNEFIKAHRRIEEQDKRIDELTAQLKEQAEQIRNVNDKVEMNWPGPQIVVNDP
jgi:hypothetical protein